MKAAHRKPNASIIALIIEDTAAEQIRAQRLIRSGRETKQERLGRHRICLCSAKEAVSDDAMDARERDLSHADTC